MAKRQIRAQRPTAVPEHPDTVDLTLSSGYTVKIEPMPYGVYQKLQARLKADYPEPELPMVDITLDDGSTTQVVAGDRSPEGLQYLMDAAGVARDRAEFLLDFMLDHYLVEMVDVTEEDVIADGHIQKSLAMLRLLEDDAPADDDPDLWAYVFRHCVLASKADFDLVKANILMLTSPVTQEEIAEAGASFWRDLPGQKRPNA